MKETEKAVYGQIVLGEQVEVWLKSQVGRYVMECKEKVERKVMEEFRKVDPYDPQAVLLLQRALDAASEAVRWLEEAVIQSRQMEQILTGETKEMEALYE